MKKEKYCSNCNEIKSVKEFYLNRARYDGLGVYCKTCCKIRYKGMRENYLKNLKKCPSKYKQYLEQMRKHCKRYQKNLSSETKIENAKKWRRNNPEKYKMTHNCYVKLYRALKKGIVKKQIKCEICNKETRLHAHHEDYNKPLKVIWLCPACHKSLKYNQGRIYKS